MKITTIKKPKNARYTPKYRSHYEKIKGTKEHMLHAVMREFAKRMADDLCKTTTRGNVLLKKLLKP